MACQHKNISPMLTNGGDVLVNVCQKCGYRFIGDYSKYKKWRRQKRIFSKYDIAINMIILRNNLIIQTIKFSVFGKKKLSSRIDGYKVFFGDKYDLSRAKKEITFSKGENDSIAIPYQSFDFATNKLYEIREILERYFEKNQIKGTVINSFGKRREFILGSFSKKEMNDYLVGNLTYFEINNASSYFKIMDGLIYVEYDIENFEEVTSAINTIKNNFEIKKHWEEF